MAKRVELTEELKNKIRSRLGNDVDFLSLAFYQARIVSTEPISQNSLYNKSRLSRSTIYELEEFFNQDPYLNVNLQVMHDQSVLPVGRVVVVRAVDDFDGSSALYGIFCVSTEHQEYINKLDNGIIDEVSISMLAKKLICSECGFDLREASQEEQFAAFFFHTCPKCEKEFGREAYLNLVGVEEFIEVSLVTKGAARHAKILDSSKQLALAANNKEVKLKLSQLTKELLPLNLNGKILIEENTMEMEELLAKFQELSDNLTSFKDEVESKFEEISKREEAPAEVEDVNKEPASEEDKPTSNEEVEQLRNEVNEAKESLAASEASFNELKTYFVEEVNKVLVAAGKEKVSVDASFADLKKSLESSRLTLAANIPSEGVSKAAIETGMKAQADAVGYTAAQLAAMKLKK